MAKKTIKAAKVKAAKKWRYLSRLPVNPAKPGTIIAHSHVRAIYENQPPGLNGFRGWTIDASAIAHYKVCKCGWSGLVHYTPRTAGVAPSVKGKIYQAPATE